MTHDWDNAAGRAHGGHHIRGMGLIFTPVLVRRLLGPPGLSGLMTSTSWTHETPSNPVWGPKLLQLLLLELYMFSHEFGTCGHFDANAQVFLWIFTWWPNHKSFVLQKFCTIRYISKVIQRSWSIDKEEGIHKHTMASTMFHYSNQHAIKYIRTYLTSNY